MKPGSSTSQKRTGPAPNGVDRPLREATERPRTRPIVGVEVSMVDYAGAVEVMESMIERRERGYVCAVAVHATMLARRDPELAAALAGSTMTVPDGMPLVWAASLLGEGLTDRVYGPQLMVELCRRSAENGHRTWLYGGRDQGALVQLTDNLRRRFPGIQVVGGYAPPFRPPSVEEEDRVAEMINEARADVVWCGIGAPKQEKWMARMRDRIDAPVLAGVGAAFDFIGGRVSQAPDWMQKRGLEWTYRIAQEPRRLLPRYLYYNPTFMAAFARQYMHERRTPRT